MKTNLELIRDWMFADERGAAEKGIEKELSQPESEVRQFLDWLARAEPVDATERGIKTIGLSNAPLYNLAADGIQPGLPKKVTPLEIAQLRLGRYLANILACTAKCIEPDGFLEPRIERDGREVVIRLRDDRDSIVSKMMQFPLLTRSSWSPGSENQKLMAGLNVVQSLIDYHGGSITTRTVGPGGDRELIFRLPVPHLKLFNGNVPTLENLIERDRSTPSRVLVVDDTPLVREYVKMILGLNCEHIVETANDGLSALELAARFHPDLVILDIRMPYIDGVQVARQLRTQPEFGLTRIVALTAHGCDELRKETRNVGFDLFVNKPFEPEQLVLLASGITQPKRR